ncbi:hypothetical protein AAK894_12980 [Lachnospiraceae bacterium 46-61]
MTEKELITNTLLPTIETLVKKVEISDQAIKELGEKQKKLEREIKYYWRIMTVLLFLQLGIILYKELFMPFIYWLYQLF